MNEDRSQRIDPMVKRVDVAIRSIDDLEKFLESRGASVHVTPINGDATTGSMRTFASGGDRIEFSSYRNARVRGGISDDNFALGIFLRSDPPNNLWNKELSKDRLVWVRPGAEREAVYANPIDGAWIYTSGERIEKILVNRGFTGGSTLVRQAEQVCLPAPFAHCTTSSVARTRAALDLLPDSALTERTFEYAYQHLLDIFINSACVALDARFEAHDVSMGNATLVKRVEDLLVDQPDEFYLVSQLCDHLRVSRRSLQRAFLDILGVSPHCYLRNWRMTRARNQLRDGDTRNVTETAVRFGFFDTGRFAGHYRQLFGELPSETLGSR